MKQKLINMKWVFALLSVVFIFNCLSLNAFAEEQLPEGVVIGDNDGLNAKKNGEYFVNLKNVQPGQKWEKTISMMNMEKDSVYSLTMQISPPVVSGPLDLSKEIQMVITYEGKTLYEGPASGVSKDKDFQNNRMEFGTFKSGDSRAFNVTYEMPGNYTKEDFLEKSIMDNVWTFYAIKPQQDNTPKKKTSGILPQTGDIQQSMIFICLALFVTLILLFIWKNRSENKRSN